MSSTLGISSTRFTLTDIGGNSSNTWVKVNLLVDPNFDSSEPSPQGLLELIRGQVNYPGSPMRAATSTPCQQVVAGTTQGTQVFAPVIPPCKVDQQWYAGLAVLGSFIPLVSLYTWLTTAASHGALGRGRDPAAAVGLFLVLELVDIVSDVYEPLVFDSPFPVLIT